MKTYTIEELIAMPDADLNALAAELRGWFLRREVWLENRNGQEVTVAATPNAYFDLRRSYPVWQPATDRNQSGELLEWLLDKHSFAGCLNYTSPPSIEIWTSGWATAISVTISGNTARAEVIAFCAAMQAIQNAQGGASE